MSQKRVLTRSGLPGPAWHNERMAPRECPTRHARRARAVLLCAVICLLAPPAVLAQQRPLRTQDPEPIGAGQVLVGVGFDGGNDVLTVDAGTGANASTIHYDGGGGRSSLQLLEGPGSVDATADLYSVGATPGSGVSDLTIGGNHQLVYFTDLAPVLDLVAGPLVVNGTDAANAIDYRVGSVATNGLVSIDNQESIEFSNKTTLTLNGLAGSDEFNLNNPNTPTGLTAITVNGGDPTTGSDTVIVNGTAAADLRASCMVPLIWLLTLSVIALTALARAAELPNRSSRHCRGEKVESPLSPHPEPKRMEPQGI